MKGENGMQKDVPLINGVTGEYNVNKDNYIVPEGEEGLYHVIQEVKKFHQETGKRLSKPVIQKYGKKEFETIVQRQLRLQNYQVVMLHEPVKDGKVNVVKAPAQEVKSLRDELAALKEELAAMKAKKAAPKKKAQPKADEKVK